MFLARLCPLAGQLLSLLVPPLQVAYVEQLCDALAPGGKGWLHLPTAKRAGDADLGCDLAGSVGHGGMQMHYTPAPHVEDALARRGCGATMSDRGDLWVGGGMTAHVVILHK